MSSSAVWSSAGMDFTETISGLTKGQQYAFGVRAKNRAGGGTAATATTALPAVLQKSELSCRAILRRRQNRVLIWIDGHLPSRYPQTPGHAHLVFRLHLPMRKLGVALLRNPVRPALPGSGGEDAAEDRDEYIAESIFWVPPEARWPHLKAEARQPTIGVTVDRAMAAIERDNPALKDVLPKDYARPALDKQRLGQLIDMIGNIRVGDAQARSRDVLGRVYEYFLSQFASAEGKKGGEFYTPRCVVKVLVEMLEPYRGRVYDPCCGSSGFGSQTPITPGGRKRTATPMSWAFARWTCQ